MPGASPTDYGSLAAALGDRFEGETMRGLPAVALGLQPTLVSYRTMEPSQASVIKAPQGTQEGSMNGLIYLVGLVVVILAVLSFFGLR